YGYSRTKVNSDQRDFRKVRPFDELDESVQEFNTTEYDQSFRRTRGNLNSRGRGVLNFQGRGLPHKISLQNRNRNPSPIKTFLESLEQSTSEYYPKNILKDNRRSAEFRNNSPFQYDNQNRKRHYTYDDVNPYQSKKTRSSSGLRTQDRVRYRSGSGGQSSTHSQSPFRNDGYKSYQYQRNSKEFLRTQYYRSGSPSSLSSRSSSRNGRYRSRSRQRSRDRRDRTRSLSSSRSQSSSRRRYRSRSLSSSRSRSFSRNSGYRSYSGQGSSDRRDRRYKTRSPSSSRSSSRSSAYRSNSRRRSRDRKRRDYRSRTPSSSQSPSRNRAYRSNSRQRSRDRREDRRYKSRSPSRRYFSPLRYRSQSRERSSRRRSGDRAHRSKSRSRSYSPAKYSNARYKRKSNERSPSSKNQSHGLQRRESERSLSSMSSTESSSRSGSSSRSVSPNSERSRSKTPIRRERTISPSQRNKNVGEKKTFKRGRFLDRKPSRNEAFVRREYEKYEKEKEEQMLANVDDLLGKLVGNVAEHSQLELGNGTITSKEIGESSTSEITKSQAVESEYRTIQIKPKSPTNTSLPISRDVNQHPSSLHENLRISLHSDQERNVVCERDLAEKKEPCSAKKRKHSLEGFDKENLSDFTGAKKSKKILINLKNRQKLDDGGVNKRMDSTDNSIELEMGKGNAAPNMNCQLGLHQSNSIQEKATPNLASENRESQKIKVPEAETKIIQTHESANEIMLNKENMTQEKVKQSIELSINISKQQLPPSLLKSIALIKEPENRSTVETAPTEQMPSLGIQVEKNPQLNSDSSDLGLLSFDEFTDSDQELSSKASNKEGNSSNISKTNQDVIQPKSNELSSNVETMKAMGMEKSVNQKSDNALSNIADFYDELSNDSVDEAGKNYGQSSGPNDQAMVKTSTPIKNIEVSNGKIKERDSEVVKHSLFTTNSSVIDHNKSSRSEMQNSLDALNEPQIMKSAEDQESEITNISCVEFQEKSSKEKSLNSAMGSSKTCKSVVDCSGGKEFQEKSPREKSFNSAVESSQTCTSVLDCSDGTNSDQKRRDTSQKKDNSATKSEKSLKSKTPENKSSKELSVDVTATKDKISDKPDEKGKKILPNKTRTDKFKPKLSEVPPKLSSHTIKVQNTKDIKSPESKKENKSGHNSSTNTICDETLPKLVSRKDKKRDASTTSIESSDMENSKSRLKEGAKKKDKENHKETDQEALKACTKNLTDTSDTERKQLAPKGNDKNSSKFNNKEILKKSRKQNQKLPKIKLIDQEDLFQPDAPLKRSHSGLLKSKETKSKEHGTSSFTKDNKMKSSAMISSKTTTKTANKLLKNTASALTSKPSKSLNAADQSTKVCDKESTDDTESTSETDKSSPSKKAGQEENGSENRKTETTENSISRSQVADGNDKENGRKVDEVPKISPLGGKRQSRTLSVEQLKVLEKNKEVRQRTCMELKHGHTGGRKMLKSEKFQKLKHRVHAEALHGKIVNKHGVSKLKCQSRDEGKRKVLSNLSTQKTSNESTKTQEIKKPLPKSKQSETDIIAKSILQKVPGRIEIYDTNFEKVAYSSKETTKEATSNAIRRETETDEIQVSDGSLNLQEYRNVNEDVEDADIASDDENLQIDLESKSPDKRNASSNREQNHQERNQVDGKEKATNIQDKTVEFSQDCAKTSKQNIIKPTINEEVRKDVTEETSRGPAKNLLDIELFSPANPLGTITEDQIDYSDIRIMYYNCGIPQSPYVAEEDIGSAPTPGKIKPQREIIPSSKPGTPSKNSSPGTDRTTKKILSEEDFPMLSIPDTNTLQGQESQKDTIPSSRPETPNVSGSTGTEQTARKILPEEELPMLFTTNTTSLQTESNSGATNVSNSQETEASSDYGTDSNRGTPYSDISEPCDEPDNIKTDKPFVSNLPTIMPGHRNLGLNANENFQHHTDAQRVLSFLSKLRRENLENFKPIGFTHRKSFKNMQLPNPNASLTVGFLEPEKFKDPKLQCIRCNLCSKYFDPCGFLLHYDSEVMKLDEKKCLLTEPQPAVGDMEPQVRKIWDYLITLKNFLVDAKISSLGLHMEKNTKKGNGDETLGTQEENMLDIQSNRRNSSTDERGRHTLGNENAPTAKVSSYDIMGKKSVQNTNAPRQLEQLLRYSQCEVTTNQSTVTTDLPTTRMQASTTIGGFNSLEVTNVEFVQRQNAAKRTGYNHVTQGSTDSLSTGMSHPSLRAQQVQNIMPPPAQMRNSFLLPSCTQSDQTRRRSLESFHPNSNNVAAEIRNTRSVSDDLMAAKNFKKDLHQRYQEQRNAAYYQQPNLNIQTSMTFSGPQNSSQFLMRSMGSQETLNLNENPLNRTTHQNVNYQNNPSVIQTLHQQVANRLMAQNVTQSSELQINQQRASSLQQSVESHTRHQMRLPPPPYQAACMNKHSTGSPAQVGPTNHDQFFMTHPHLQQMGTTQIQPSAVHLSQQQMGTNQFQSSAVHLSQQQIGTNQVQTFAVHSSQQQMGTNQVQPSTMHPSQQQMGTNQVQASTVPLSHQQMGINQVQTSAMHLSQQQTGINQVQPSGMHLSQQQMYNQVPPSTISPAHQNITTDNQVPSTMIASAHLNLLANQVISASNHSSQQNMGFYQHQHPTMQTSVTSSTTTHYSKSTHQQQISHISQRQNNGQGMHSDRALTVSNQPVSNHNCRLDQSSFSGQIYQSKPSQNSNTQGASPQMSRSENNQLTSGQVILSRSETNQTTSGQAKVSPVSEANQLSSRQVEKISPARDVQSFLQKASKKVSSFNPGCVDSASVNPSKSDSSIDSQQQSLLAQENDGKQNHLSNENTPVSATNAISSKQGMNTCSNEPNKSKSLLESAAELAQRINGPAEVQKRVVGSCVNMMASVMWLYEQFKETRAEVTTAKQELQHCKGEITKAVNEYHATEELMTQKINEVLAKMPK
ncbi:uncharacterized protein LOC133190659, partial [Saccostrea echinata]|uniref:uncharacterized protein LOC133190659 n=1 Tax=Saccostrea echinata TaxID=191078 RepID=UPI002A80609D